MIKCKECGAELPPEARFCLQCGVPVQRDEPEPHSSEPPPPPPPLDFLRPAIVGGAFLGLLSSIPLVSIGCCFWILGGGAFAAYMLIQQRPARGGVTYGDAAFVGVMSGFFGALISTVVSIPVKSLTARIFGKDQQDALENALRDTPGLEGPMRDLLLRVASSEISSTTLLFTFFSDVILYSLLAMIGAIVMVAVFNKKGGRVSQPPNRGQA